MNSPNRKQVVVIAGPAGSGKTSIANEIVHRYGKKCVKLVTATTRAPREGERDGVEYHFFSKERFLSELHAGTIAEYWHAVQTDRFYGTYIPDLERKIADGKIVIAVLQLKGAKYLKEHFNATGIFILPDSMSNLEKRIVDRGAIGAEALKERLEIARKEVKYEAPLYDHRIKNEYGKMNEAVDAVLAIMREEGYDI